MSNYQVVFGYNPTVAGLKDSVVLQALKAFNPVNPIIRKEEDFREVTLNINSLTVEGVNISNLLHGVVQNLKEKGVELSVEVNEVGMGMDFIVNKPLNGEQSKSLSNLLDVASANGGSVSEWGSAKSVAFAKLSDYEDFIQKQETQLNDMKSFMTVESNKVLNDVFNIDAQNALRVVSVRKP